MRRLLLLIPSAVIVLSACTSPGMDGAEYAHARDYCTATAWGEWLAAQSPDQPSFRMPFDEVVALGGKCLEIVDNADELRCELDDTKRWIEASFLVEAFPNNTEVRTLYDRALNDCANAERITRLIPEERKEREDARVQVLLATLGVGVVALAIKLYRVKRVR